MQGSQAGVLTMFGSLVSLQTPSCLADLFAGPTDNAAAHCEWWRHGLNEFQGESWSTVQTVSGLFCLFPPTFPTYSHLMAGRALQSRAVQNANLLPLMQPLPPKCLAHLKPTKKGQKKNVDIDSEPAGPPMAAK